jgi:uncharacterized iron-regulated membrane protein
LSERAALGMVHSTVLPLYCEEPSRKFHNFHVLGRRALFQLHLWIGVSTGLYIAVVCTTGAALVFRIDLQRAMHPDLFTPKAAGPPAHPADIIESVKRAFPDDHVSGVDAPTTVRPTYLAYSSQGSQFRTLLLDPVSGELLGELHETSFVRTLQDLHFDLLAGRRGRAVNGIGGLLLLTMCVTGMVIWWPGRTAVWRGVRVDFSRSWKRVNWELHNAVGFWTVIFTAMWAVTGVNFAFPAAFRNVVNRVSPITMARTPQSGPDSDAPAPTWRALVDAASQHAPVGYHVARVVLPSTPAAPFLVMFSGVTPAPPGATLTSIYLDQYTGALLTSASVEKSFGDAIMAWVAPLHVGNFAGNGVRVLWMLCGLAPPLLFVTGFTMWWTRVVRPRARRQRAGAIAASSTE